MVRGPQPREILDRELFETTTGATAITESLQLQRMLGINWGDDAKRTVDLASIQGIDIAEHPWLTMMGDKKPAPEPLARLVPFDNYYIRFTSFSKFADFHDFLDQWGTPAGRASSGRDRPASSRNARRCPPKLMVPPGDSRAAADPLGRRLWQFIPGGMPRANAEPDGD